MRGLLLCIGCIVVIAAFVSKTEAAQFVKVNGSFVNIYEQLDPKSNVIKQARKGDYLELVYEGTSWYQVKVKDKIGWMEKRTGDVVDKQGSVVPIVLAGFVVLLIATGGAVFFVISRHKTVELS